MLKVLQVRFQQYVNWKLPDVQAGFRKGRGIRDQIVNIHWIIKKLREFQKNMSVQLSRWVVSDSATPWNAALQVSLSIINSWSLLKLMCIKLVMSSNPLILSRTLLLLPLIFPSIRVFSNKFFTSGGQSMGALASVLPMNIQNWFPLGLIGLTSL